MAHGREWAAGRSPGLPPQRLPPRVSTCETAPAARSSASTARAGSLILRADDGRLHRAARRLPGPRPPRLCPHRPRQPGGERRSHLPPGLARAGRGRVGLRGRQPPPHRPARLRRAPTSPSAPPRLWPPPGSAARPSAWQSSAWRRAERAQPAPERERDTSGAGHRSARRGAAGPGAGALRRAPGPCRAAGARWAALPGQRAARPPPAARGDRATSRPSSPSSRTAPPPASRRWVLSACCARTAAGSGGCCAPTSPTSPARASGSTSAWGRCATRWRRRAPARRPTRPGSAPRRHRSRPGSVALDAELDRRAEERARIAERDRPPYLEAALGAAPRARAPPRALARRPCASSRATGCAVASPTPSGRSGPSRPTRPAAPSTAEPWRGFARRAPRSSAPSPATARRCAPASPSTSTGGSMVRGRPASATMTPARDAVRVRASALGADGPAYPTPARRRTIDGLREPLAAFRSGFRSRRAAAAFGEAPAGAPRSEAPETAPFVEKEQSRPALLLVVRGRRLTPCARDARLAWEAAARVASSTAQSSLARFARKAEAWKRGSGGHLLWRRCRSLSKEQQATGQERWRRWRQRAAGSRGPGLGSGAPRPRSDEL